MKLKINKLLPYSEQSRKYKTPTVTINNKTYSLSPYPLQKNNNVGIIIPLQFICTMPEQNSDYEYLKCNVLIQSYRSELKTMTISKLQARLSTTSKISKEAMVNEIFCLNLSLLIEEAMLFNSKCSINKNILFRPPNLLHRSEKQV